MDYLRDYQKRAIESSNQHKKCLINMWCGTGKTDTFTIDIFIQEESINVIVFPSLQLVQQYYKEYILSLEEPFQREFKKYKCLAFCSENENEYDNDSKLKRKKSIPYTTDKTKLITFFKDKNKKIIMVTYQSFEKFINSCISENININKLIYDEAHHIVGDKIQNVIFNNDALKVVVDKTRFYTATPVNKNGITMYDKDDPDNSDCGVLAYEYLYYQAIKDNICKVFETQIMLYTQKSEYTNKYQPIFESIIRTCLSGKYNFWNVLTYHTFVEKSDTQNTMISFVKEFASPENKILLKKQFTKIQDEEFPHTKNLYKVEDVNLYELHSNCKDRDDIIKQFNQKVEGRIYILSSCCILNEGINTKWANMSVPINPTNSIVKESQRIGRLSRTPEENMPPAIVLIPCQIDILKYTSIDTPEQRNQMIREELSESGNFNTALNVISAFQYQYDPDIYEECLRYPNMYSPNEVKSNLENHGLHVEESQGTLIDNLKYVSNNNINEEGHDDQTILNKVAKQRDKTIEIHTQNYDQPITYINEEATDDEPLRLFYCEDEDIYLPIVNKEKNIPRKSITPPKKRQKLFNVHTHSDLEVLWNIRENSIDLSKEFSQGILDVNVSYNEKKWKENYDLLKEYNDTPSFKYVTTCGVKLGSWCGTQRRNKKKNKLSQEHIDLLEKIPNWYWEQDEQWNKTYTLLKEYNDTPSQTYVTTCGVKLGKWCQTQKTNKKKNKLSQERIDLLEKIPNWYWCKKDMSKPEIKPHKKTGSHKPPPKSVLSELHKQYKTMTSYNIHEYFEQNPEKWKYYHEISKENERSFPTEEIPRNKMIKYLEKLPGKKQKVIADLGCGFAEINKHFKDNPRFKFHNFDHYSHNDLVISRDIYDTQLEDYSVDIVIMSLTMWGSNCNDYILEAYRILDKGGTLLIAEPYKRWNKELNEHGKPINRLVNLLEENNFTIQEKYEGKFMFIECSRYK